MQYMTFELYADDTDISLDGISFFESDLPEDKVVKDQLKSIKKAVRDDGYYVPMIPMSEYIREFSPRKWSQKVMGFHIGDNGHIFIVKAGDPIWQMVAGNVTEKQDVPVKIAKKFHKFISKKR